MLCLRYGIAVSMIRINFVNQIRLISLPEIGPEFETQYIKLNCISNSSPHLIGICS